MSNEKYNISRRSVLGGLGAVGLASAGAGLGTTAFLNDTEEFSGNSITAGELDLLVDWQQHYYGASEEWEFVNAHPDHDGDGEQSLDLGDDEVVSYSDEDRNIANYLNCSNLDHNYDFSSDARPEQSNLVDLDDVKPGDMGEITFSVHLCDNPGYLWLTTDNFSESGGELTEPERVSMNESDPSSVIEGDDTGDLAENTFVEFWYDDNCNNKLDTEFGGGQSDPLCVQIVLDASGSMDGAKNTQTIAGAQALAESILNANSDNRVGVTFFSGSGYSNDAQVQLSVDSTDDADTDGTVDPQDLDTVNNTIGSLPANGSSTAIGAGVEAAQNDLQDCPDGHERIMVVLSNGGENAGTDPIGKGEAACSASPSTRIFTIAVGGGNTGIMEGIACDPADAYQAADSSTIQAIFDEISQEIAEGETVILGEGDGLHTEPVSLAEAMDIMERNDGRIPLDADGNMGWNAGDADAERTCYEAGESYCIGARWWVPTEVGNEIQGDSVSFDLGFYAEQCRHNNGAGQVPTTPVNNTST